MEIKQSPCQKREKIIPTEKGVKGEDTPQEDELEA